MAFTKQDALKLIQELPEDSNLDDIVNELVMMQQLERGLKQAEEGNCLSDEEARQRFKKWLDD